MLAGKSTAATVIARACGFEVVEFNASDVRSKKSINAAIGDVTENRPMSEFFAVEGAAGSAAAKAPPKRRSNMVIIMDEVDGMGGNVSLSRHSALSTVVARARADAVRVFVFLFFLFS